MGMFALFGGVTLQSLSSGETTGREQESFLLDFVTILMDGVTLAKGTIVGVEVFKALRGRKSTSGSLRQFCVVRP